VPGPAPINRGSLWGDAFEAAYKPKEEMFELAGALRKKGVLIGILSNTEPSAVEFFQRQKYPEVSGFDVLVFSCQQGIKKPDERIFKKTIELLGVRPARAVFVDDKKENITAAEKLGLVGILFDNIENLRYELSKLGIRI
jgi:putative hydrolase of the HAD superfamily